jgi:ATP-binding cassette subfamily B protein
MRLDMTNELVEAMVGHRTRLAQQAPAQWHEGEDRALASYLAQSSLMDGAARSLLAIIPRGWLLIGLVGIAPAFISGSASPTLLAIGLGGTLLAYRAMMMLSTSISHLAGAKIAWEQAAPMFQAAVKAEPLGLPALSCQPPAGDADEIVLEAHDLAFRFPHRNEPVLQSCHLRIGRGARVLLEGPSGSGKSTLSSILTGLRNPDAGLVLLRGMDRNTLGAANWQVVSAPQFHENHVLTGTFAFNLLMGRKWPPTDADVQTAIEICRELDLEGLINRMPAGILQMVGETGWQLSHGERSRLFIARTLLQGVELIILDESFASLDPETLNRAMQCVLKRAPALLVIAHP